MTREEVKEKWKISDGVLAHSSLIRLTNFIYDDFESRTCDGCKYTTGCDYKLLADSNGIDPDKFSCNQWGDK